LTNFCDLVIIDEKDDDPIILNYNNSCDKNIHLMEFSKDIRIQYADKYDAKNQEEDKGFKW